MLNEMSFPTLEYLKFGNIYSGSVNGYNFKIFPYESVAKASIWKGRYCYEMSDILKSKEFRLDVDGFKDMKNWVSSNILYKH